MSDTGRQGEALVAAVLSQRGYMILHTNWRSPDPEIAGELDIVARQGGELVVIEVKTRRGKAAHDNALESITPAKQAKLLRLAEAYLHTHQLQVGDQLDITGIRLDVAVVVMQGELGSVEIFENAVGW